MAAFSFTSKIKSFFNFKSNGIAGALNTSPLEPTTQKDPNDPYGLGKLAGIFNPKQAGKKIRDNWSFKRAAEEGFEGCVWVYACVSLWMSQVASVPWIVRNQDADGSWNRVPDHTIERFLRAPNPVMSGNDLMEYTTCGLLLGGNELWKKVYVKNGKKLKEVWPMDMDRIKPIPDLEALIARYAQTINGKDVELEASDVVHFLLPGPSIFWGISPLKAAGKLVDIDCEAVNWWSNAINSGCRKDGVLSFNHDLTEDEYAHVIAQVRLQLLSAISGRFPIILGHEAKFEPYDLSPAEMDFIDSRKSLREEIVAAFHVPPPMVGILDHSTYNNLTTARRIFWVDAIIPFLERLKGTLNRCIKPDFIKEGDLDNWIIDYDISKVEALADDFSKKLEQAQILYGMGVPLNVIAKRLELDLPDIEGGDLGYILENYVPLEQLKMNMQQSADTHKATMSQMKVDLETSKNPPQPMAAPGAKPSGAKPGQSPAKPSKPVLGAKPPSAGPKLASQLPGEKEGKDDGVFDITMIDLPFEEKQRLATLIQTMRDVLESIPEDLTIDNRDEGEV